MNNELSSVKLDRDFHFLGNMRELLNFSNYQGICSSKDHLVYVVSLRNKKEKKRREKLF